MPSSTRRCRSHLEPVLTIFQAPNWASGKRVEGERLRRCEQGQRGEVPRLRRRAGDAIPGQVHYYEVWNEPNLPWFFTPQLKNGKFVSPARYRALVNAFATASTASTPSAIVIARQHRSVRPSAAPRARIGPKPFLKGVVSAKVQFDAWSTHPYTYGGPTHHANNDSDVSLGDMGELRKILNKARSSGKILGSHKPQLWASEFSWDSKGRTSAASG